MGKSKKKKCGLCHVKKRKIEFNDFFVIDCKKCDVPTLVLKKHKPTLSAAEKQAADYIYREYFKPKGLVPRNMGMRSSPGHWHEHFVSKRN